jgi:hypothetical protein
MATVLISEAEKTYVLHGVQEDVRVDGRGRKDVRPIVFESGLVKMIEKSFHYNKLLITHSGFHSFVLFRLFSVHSLL